MAAELGACCKAVVVGEALRAARDPERVGPVALAALVMVVGVADFSWSVAAEIAAATACAEEAAVVMMLLAVGAIDEVDGV